jgi:hypothetical protein
MAVVETVIRSLSTVMLQPLRNMLSMLMSLGGDTVSEGSLGNEQQCNVSNLNEDRMPLLAVTPCTRVSWLAAWTHGNT